MAEQGNCDTCVNFVYDEDYEYYVCEEQSFTLNWLLL